MTLATPRKQCSGMKKSPHDASGRKDFANLSPFLSTLAPPLLTRCKAEHLIPWCCNCQLLGCRGVRQGKCFPGAEPTLNTDSMVTAPQPIRSLVLCL